MYVMMIITSESAPLTDGRDRDRERLGMMKRVKDEVKSGTKVKAPKFGSIPFK